MTHNFIPSDITNFDNATQYFTRFEQDVKTIVDRWIPRRNLIASQQNRKFGDHKLRNFCSQQRLAAKSGNKRKKNNLGKLISARISELRSASIEALIDSGTSIIEVQKRFKTLRRSQIPEVVEAQDGAELTDDLQIANEFNKFFASSFATEDADVSIVQHADVVQQSELIVTVAMVTNILQKFDCKKSEGDTVLPNKVIDNCRLSLVNCITKFLNDIRSAQCIPDQLKISVITPICKSGKPRNKISSYRPISISPNLAKILDSVIVTNLQELAIQNQIDYPNQYGFSSGIGTETQLIDLNWMVTQELDDATVKFVQLSFFDFSDAFIKVPVNLINHCAASVGVAGNFQRIFANKFENRSQVVRIGQTRSAPAQTTSGVSQGGLDSPEEFRLCMRTLPPTNSVTKLYADDTMFAFPIRSAGDIVIQQVDVQNLINWCSKSKFKLHPLKSEILKVKIGDRGDIALPLCIGETAIAVVENHKHLGVTFDEFWTFSSQVDNVVKTAFRAWFSFRHSFPRLTWKVYLLAYKSYVLPILEYANLAYYPTPTEFEKIEKVQKSALRFIYTVKSGHKGRGYGTRLQEFDMQSIEVRRAVRGLRLLQNIRQQSLFPFGHLRVPQPWTLRILFHVNRNGIFAKIPITRLRFADRNCFFIAAQNFNLLPMHLRNAVDRNSFISRVRSHYGHQATL